MISKDVLSGAISELDKSADTIEQNTKQLLLNTPFLVKKDSNFGTLSYYWDITKRDESLQRIALREYQRWYAVAHQLIKDFIPEKEDEFVHNYNKTNPEGILRFIQLECYTRNGNKQKIINEFNISFELQRSILLSIPYVAEIKELNLRNIIASDFIDSELDKADYLYRSGFARCGGVLAGVALERHLKALCDMKKVEYKHNDTIEPLSQALYDAGKIDPTELKNFQHLGGIRNDCAHPKDVSEEDLKGRAKEIIEKVKKLTL
jgi:hypothetical protein